MRLSDKLSDVRFSRGVAGYNTKEVDAFLQALAGELLQIEERLDALTARAALYDAEKEKITQEKAAADELLSLAESKAKKLLSEAQAAARACEHAAQIETEELRRSAESKAQNRLHAAQVQAEGMIADADVAAKEKIAEAEAGAARILSEADRRGQAMLAEAKAKTAAETDRYAEIVAAGRGYTASVAEITEKLRGELAALNDRTKPHLEAVLAARPAPAEQIAPAAPAARKAAGGEDAPVAQALDVPMPEERSGAGRIERRAMRTAHGAQNASAAAQAPAVAAAGSPAVQDYSFAGGRIVGDEFAKGESPVKPYGNLNVTYAGEDNGFADVEKIMQSGKAPKHDPTEFAE